MVRPATPTTQLTAFRDSLLQRIQTATNRQLRDLRIDCTNDSVCVTGLSRTFYAKQLVTHAVRAMAPGTRLENQIRVCAN